MDLYAVFRDYNFRCALSLFGVELSSRPCISVQKDLLRAVFLLDSKVFSPVAVESGYGSIASISDWLNQKCPDPLLNDQLDYDRTMLAVTASESIAYLLFTYFTNQHSLKTRATYTTNTMIDECLRYDSPIQMVRRIARVDFDVGCLNISIGDRVYLHIGAANRDPSVFAKPEVFTPARDRRSLSFGLGKSSCPGAGFAHRCASAFIDVANTNYRIALDFSTGLYKHGLAGRGGARIVGKVCRSQ